MIYLLLLLNMILPDVRDGMILSLENHSYANIINLKAQNNEERLVLALSYIKQNNIKKADILTKQITKPYPKGYNYVLGLINEVYKKNKQAYLLFKNSIKQNEYIYKSEIELGRLKRSQKKIDEAVAYWNTVLSEPLISKHDKSQIHFLIAESLYNKYRYQNARDRSILDDAITHLDKIEDRKYSKKAEQLRPFIKKLELGYINSEDAKNLDLKFVTDLGLVKSPRFYVLDWQNLSYFSSTDKFLFSRVLGSFYYSPIRNNDGSFRVYFGLDLGNEVYTNLDNKDNLSFWNSGIGTKIKWQTYHNLMSFTCLYLADFKFINITNSQYLGVNHKIDLLSEYLINKYFLIFLDFPLKLFSLASTEIPTIASGYDLSFGGGVYFLYNWLKIGTSAYYSSISTDLQTGSGYKLNALIAFNFFNLETGFKYKLSNLNFETGTLHETNIGGFMSYLFTGSFSVSAFANIITNTTLNNQSFYSGLNVSLVY